MKQTKNRRKVNQNPTFFNKNDSTLDSDKYHSNMSQEKLSSSKKKNQSFLTNLTGGSGKIFQSESGENLRGGNLLVSQITPKQNEHHGPFIADPQQLQGYIPQYENHGPFIADPHQLQGYIPQYDPNFSNNLNNNSMVFFHH